MKGSPSQSGSASEARLEIYEKDGELNAQSETRMCGRHFQYTRNLCCPVALALGVNQKNTMGFVVHVVNISVCLVVCNSILINCFLCANENNLLECYYKQPNIQKC